MPVISGMQEFEQRVLLRQATFMGNRAIGIDPYTDPIGGKASGQPDVVHGPKYFGNVEGEVRQEVGAEESSGISLEVIDESRSLPPWRSPKTEGCEAMQAEPPILGCEPSLRSCAIPAAMNIPAVLGDDRIRLMVPGRHEAGNPVDIVDSVVVAKQQFHGKPREIPRRRQNFCCGPKIQEAAHDGDAIRDCRQPPVPIGESPVTSRDVETYFQRRV